MVASIFPLTEETDNKIEELILGEYALLVTCTKSTLLSKNVDVISLYTFTMQSYRRLLDTSKYTLAIFKLDGVHPQFQYAYHMNSYRRVVIFMRNLPQSYKLHYDPEIRYNVVYTKDKHSKGDLQYNTVIERLDGLSATDNSKPQNSSQDSPYKTASNALKTGAQDRGGKYGQLKSVEPLENNPGPNSEAQIVSTTSVADLINIENEYLDYWRIQTVTIGDTSFPSIASVQLALCIFQEIKQSLEKIFVFISTCNCSITDDDVNETAEVNFPMFGIKITCEKAVLKKDRTNLCHIEVLKALYEKDVLDEHLSVNDQVLFSLPTINKMLMHAYNTTDLKAINEIRLSNISGNEALSYDRIMMEIDGKVELCRSNDEQAGFAKFKKQHMIDFPSFPFNGSYEKSVGSPPVPTAQLYLSRIEELYRKIPENLLKLSEELALYVFNKGRTGILCTPSFDTYSGVGRHGNPIEITKKETYKPTPEQLIHIKLYQILFFKMHVSLYKSEKKAVNYYYYVVPLLEDASIDWEYIKELHTGFLTGSVEECSNLADHLIWNPFNRSFSIYVNEFDGNIEDTVDGITFLEYFEQTYKVNLIKRKGRLIFKSLGLERAVSHCRKQAVTYAEDTDKFQEEARAYLDNLSEGCSKEKKGSFFLSSKEACFVTSVKKSIIIEAILFENMFFIFDNVCAIHELSSRLGLPLDLCVQALTHSKINPHRNYETLEFFGDCILKFIVTNTLTLAGHPLKELVSLKDSIISNDALAERFMKTDIGRYVTKIVPCCRVFQPPTLSGLEQFKRYFSVKSIFESDNVNGYLSTIPEPKRGQDKKVHADIIEGLIGAAFLTGELPLAIDLALRLKIIEPIKDKKLSSDPPGNFPSLFKPIFPNFTTICSSLDMPYASFIAPQNIRTIEGILNYSFSNPGFLERALVHPSFGNNVFGSNNFQLLELIGDAALDLFVVKKIFHREDTKSPERLHGTKQSYVNNATLGACVFYSDMFKHVMVGKYFDADHIKSLINGGKAIPKTFGDIFEAVIGAIICDLNWEFDKFSIVIESKLWELMKQFQCSSYINCSNS